jgi:predicted DNA-binding protein
MPKKNGYNSDDYRTTSFRLEKQQVRRLATLAGQLQAAAGYPVSMSDIVREALDNYLKEHKV